MVFAKNSDRPPGEPQITWPFGRRSSAGCSLRTQYLTIGDTGAHAALLSCPTWLWGAEHGVNEHGVAIGNERIATTHDAAAAPPALIGMDLVRLGLEHGRHEGLGWLDGSCVALPPAQGALKVPHMGWNELSFARPDHPVLRGLRSGAHVYFVHSYHVTGVPQDQVLATTEYGIQVVAMIGRDNLAGTQFHPEKSQAAGLRLICNFLRWRP